MWQLIEAIKQNDFKAVQKFLKTSDFDVTDRYKHSPLHKASYVGNAKIVQLLLDNGMDINAKDIYGLTPISDAIESENLHIVKLLVANGVDINDPVCSSGLTALHRAVDHDIVNTPYHIEMRLRSIPLLKFLIASGANVNSSNNIQKKTPLHHAAFQGNLHVVKLLVANGAEIDKVDVYGNTPIHVARTEVIEKFLVKSLPEYVLK
jgi:ankyrin repeat protein